MPIENSVFLLVVGLVVYAISAIFVVVKIGKAINSVSKADIIEIELPEWNNGKNEEVSISI